MHSTGHPVLRRSTEVNWGQMRSMTFADFFRVLLPSKVIWGADFDSDIHFTLRRLEMTSCNHQVIKGQWRHMTRKWFFEFFTHKIIRGHSKTIVTCSTGRKEHAGRWNVALAPSEAKLSAITVFVTFRHLTWPQRSLVDLGPLSLYINLFVSRRATRSFFPRSSSSIRGETARGGRTNPPPPPPCAVEGCEMACAGEG